MTSLTEILQPFNSERLVEWFGDLCDLWHNTAPLESDDHFSPKGMTQWVHYNNFVLWHLEDDARCVEASAEIITKCKRAIDKHEQQRHAAIERIDSWIAQMLQNADIKPQEGAPVNTITPGMLIDRLSILSLKVFHMAEQLDRKDVDKDHKEMAKTRLAIFKEQQQIVADGLDRLFLDLRQAKAVHKIYKHFDMHNDPKFNPVLAGIK